MYFKSFACISPSGILTPDRPLDFDVKLSGSPALGIEPDYGPWISPMQLRRMSKPVRMGVACAKMCLKEESVNATVPASIHTGTAYGMLGDTETFLSNLISREEKMLAPTAFIQSTHNTVGGQIALALQCNAPNMTFVHGGHSFESAVMDATLSAQDHPGQAILLGGIEELTPTSFDILSRCDLYNEQVIAGEGASFFQVIGKRTEACIARLEAFELFRWTPQEKPLSALFSEFLHQNHLAVKDQDFCLLGSANRKPEALGYESLKSWFPEANTVAFKSYCGEYPTAAAFALGLALSILQRKPRRKVWIINNYGSCWSFWCISNEGVIF